MTAEPTNDDDAAWVTIETPFDADRLRRFLEDIKRLYRINSMLEFEELRQTGDREYRLKAKNLSNGRSVETDLEVRRADGGVIVTYSNGLKTSTTFRVDPKPDGNAQLVVTDDYGGTSGEEREARIDEVDKSLVQWGRDLHRYLRLSKRWSAVPGWNFYMRRVWQPMKPSARRICYLLSMITLAEFVVFLMVFSVFWLELDKFLD
ncbi:MAG: hypothetical protein CMM08_08050 [Rhodospirillaceae bacterium]|jgi:hypothetical protein|nr:hypothetical protein [Rhodospirillaceae bacterium]|tara:strand:- start:2999 stop:3613 length:615 start_codon:yes stop_codon:yes gene_type:complete